MRTAELIQASAFLYFAVLAVRLPGPRRNKVFAISAIGLTSLGAASFLPQTLATSVLRDWLVAPQMLFVYWQAGQFFERVDHSVQDILERADQRLLPAFLGWLAHTTPGRIFSGYFELSYLLCYPMIPFAVGALYILRLRPHVDVFWTVVLSATYLSYAVLPWIQTMPPRMLDEKWVPEAHQAALRRFNLWLLRNASIHANTFPSAHAASSSGAALVVAYLAPWPAGIAFGTLAAGIAFGTFCGRSTTRWMRSPESWWRCYVSAWRFGRYRRIRRSCLPGFRPCPGRSR